MKFNQNTKHTICKRIAETHFTAFKSKFPVSLFGYEDGFIQLHQNILLNSINIDIQKCIKQTEAQGEELEYYQSIKQDYITLYKKESDLFISKLDRIG